MENKLPKRQPTRLKHFDYSTAGAYFVTICVQNRKQILSRVVDPAVGVGAHDDPQIRLTKIGEVVETHLLSSENISGVKIDEYVIMPDHMHVIIRLCPNQHAAKNDGSSRAPTPTNKMLPHVVSTFKRFCHKELGENIFQRGYAEHIIRDRDDYETRKKYIRENPMRWYYKYIHSEK